MGPRADTCLMLEAGKERPRERKRERETDHGQETGHVKTESVSQKPSDRVRFHRTRQEIWGEQPVVSLSAPGDRVCKSSSNPGFMLCSPSVCPNRPLSFWPSSTDVFLKGSLTNLALVIQVKLHVFLWKRHTEGS